MFDFLSALGPLLVVVFVYVTPIVLVFYFFWRLVRALERIAKKMERK